MCKMISSVLSFFLSLFVFIPVFAEEYPVLHMRLGNVDAYALIEKLADDGTEIKEVIDGKQTIEGYGEDIGKEKAHLDIYNLNKMTIYIQEPSGEIHIDWNSAVKKDYEQIEKQQKEKYDADDDGFLDDGKTLFCTRIDHTNEEAADNVKKANQFVQKLAQQLGVSVMAEPVIFRESTFVYPDGQNLKKGSARYAIVRNGLMVETEGYWSEISRTGYYVESEALNIEWCGDEITSANINIYYEESEEKINMNLISLEEAKNAVNNELQRRIRIEGMEPIVDICYMPMPDSKGELYAEFVPAWRFRFRGEDGNTHRVNAYTGEVIR